MCECIGSVYSGYIHMIVLMYSCTYTVVCSAPGGKVRAALETVYTIFTNDSQYGAVMRCAVANRILLTLMKNCLVDTIKEFFAEHISDVMAVIEAKESKVRT